MAFYTAEDHRKSVSQVVVEVTEPHPAPSKFGVLRLDAKYQTLMTNLWAVGLFRLAGDPGPYLLVRADGQTTRLKSQPFRVAFCFYRMQAGGLIAVFVDFPKLRNPRAPAAPFVLFEMIRGIDLDDVRHHIRDAINGPRLHMCFAEGEGPGEDLASGVWAGGAIDALYDVRVDLDAACRDALQRAWTSLLDYHDSLPGGSRDFQASVRQMQMENPLTENPILDRPTEMAVHHLGDG